TAEYGSQMLSLGGVHHLTGGSKKEGVVTCETLLALCNKEAVELVIDGGSTVVVQADRTPIVNGTREERVRVGCGSAAIGMFAPQWKDHVDEVIVVDDHITGVLSEHQGGRFLDMKPRPAKMPVPVRHVVERIAENCEPALCTVLFMAGAGGSLRAGVTENPVRLTRSVREALTKVTLGGQPAFVWPGGGITLMVDVA